MTKSIRLLTTVLLLCFLTLSVQGQVPPKPDSVMLVNDFAGILGDTQAMEDSLERIAVHTSNQICVVTMNDLGDLTPAMMAQQIGEVWGVGGVKYNNGVVILIKPKTEDSKGEVYISTGYGLQGTISDAKCSRIARKHMIPHFMDSDYVGGTWAGINEVYKLAVSEYNEHQGSGKKDTDGINVWDLMLGGVVVGGAVYGVRRWRKRNSPQQPAGEGDGEADEGKKIPGTIAAGSVAAAVADEDEEEAPEEIEEEEPKEEEEPEDPNKWHGFEGGKFGGSGGGASW